MTTERQRFEELFRTHYAALMRYAIRRVGSDSASEVVSETLLTAWRRLADVPDDPLPWLYATARRVVANEYRRRGRAGRLTQHIVGSTPHDDGSDHADAVVERLRVREALERLSPGDREALMLAEWEQLSPADAAKVLGCSPAAYRVRLHRARRRIATLLHVDEDVPPASALALVPMTSRGTTS